MSASSSPEAIKTTHCYYLFAAAATTTTTTTTLLQQAEDSPSSVTLTRLDHPINTRNPMHGSCNAFNPSFNDPLLCCACNWGWDVHEPLVVAGATTIATTTGESIDCEDNDDDKSTLTMSHSSSFSSSSSSSNNNNNNNSNSISYMHMHPRSNSATCSSAGDAKAKESSWFDEGRRCMRGFIENHEIKIYGSNEVIPIIARGNILQYLGNTYHKNMNIDDMEWFNGLLITYIFHCNGLDLDLPIDSSFRACLPCYWDIFKGSDPPSFKKLPPDYVKCDLHKSVLLTIGYILEVNQTRGGGSYFGGLTGEASFPAFTDYDQVHNQYELGGIVLKRNDSIGVVEKTELVVFSNLLKVFIPLIQNGVSIKKTKSDPLTGKQEKSVKIIQRLVGAAEDKNINNGRGKNTFTQRRFAIWRKESKNPPVPWSDAKRQSQRLYFQQRLSKSDNGFDDFQQQLSNSDNCFDDCQQQTSNFENGSFFDFDILPGDHVIWARVAESLKDPPQLPSQTFIDANFASISLPSLVAHEHEQEQEQASPTVFLSCASGREKKRKSDEVFEYLENDLFDSLGNEEECVPVPKHHISTDDTVQPLLF